MISREKKVCTPKTEVISDGREERRSRAFNDNEGSMEKFLENLIIDMWGRGREWGLMK